MLPSFLYGTAWKEDATEPLVRAAIEEGFRGIDTANQRRHYREAAAGAAVLRAIEDGLVTRDALFLQTKFTYAPSQDARIPYDPRADFPTQVQQSFASSLRHLRVEAIDSYVLHGPSRGRGLGDADHEVWRTMESLHRDGKTHHLGVSNVTLEQLDALWRFAAIKPAFVQNRCYAATGWDRDVRAFCREHAIVYQGFSLLTANLRELRSNAFQRIVARTGYTPAQLVFRFARQAGMLPLTGTTDRTHMREDLAIEDITLSDDDVRAIEDL